MAISRCTGVKNLTLYDYEEPNAADNNSSTYFKTKIENHKKQDQEAKREINKNTYVTVDRFFEQIGKICPNGNKADLDYQFQGDSVTSNITADRICNSQAHT